MVSKSARAAFLAVSLLTSALPAAAQTMAPLDLTPPRTTTAAQPKAAKPAPTNQALKNLICSKPFAVISDTYHFDPLIPARVASPDFLQTLKDCSVKNLYLEIPRSFQTQLDAFMQGRINAATLRQRMGQYASVTSGREKERAEADTQFINMIAKAREIGMNVYAADFGNGSPELSEGYRLLHQGFATLKPMLPPRFHSTVDLIVSGTQVSEQTIDDISQYIVNLSNPQAIQARADISQGGALIARGSQMRLDDSRLANLVRSTTRPGERSAVLIGHAHVKSNTGIYARLGAQNASWIVLQSSRASLDVSAAHGGKPDMIIRLPNTNPAAVPNFR